MGKDRVGKSHPRKGKPFGSLQGGAGGLQPIDSSVLEENLQIAEKYTDGEEKPASNIHFRHPNRNVDKREERQRNKAVQRSDNHITLNESEEETFAVEWDDTVAKEFPAMLSKDQFTELGNYKADLCISVYVGTSSTPGVAIHVQKDFIGFKNKLQQLTLLLRERNLEQTRIERLLKPGYDLLRDEKFWTRMSQGLAVFFTDGYFRFIKLPVIPSDEVLLNSSFYLTPLIPVITAKDYFYVLVLSKKQAKFYHADAFGIQYVPVPGMPKGVEDVVHFEQKDDQNLIQTDTSGAGGGAAFHGTGSSRPDEKANLAMYFDEVDETLWKEVLNKERVPLLLAGVEYLIPIYKQVAEYKPIWEDALTGKP